MMGGGGGESSSAYADGGESTESGDAGETPTLSDGDDGEMSPEELDAAWTAFFDWSASQCWGPKCEDAGAAQFERLTAKLKELGLPVGDPF